MNLRKKKDFTALQHLSKRRDIIIKKADKGNCIVVEDTETYIANGENHLHVSDERTYTRLENDPTETVAEHIRKYLDETAEAGYLSRQVAEAIKPSTNPRTQQMYFLKKCTKHHQVYDQLYLAVMDQQNPYHNTWTTCYNQSHNNSNHTSETLKTSYN